MISQTPLPPPRTDPNDLFGKCVFNTGPLLANGEQHEFYWSNDEASPILIVKSRIWLGCDGKLQCDADADAFREVDGAIVATIQVDHYAESSQGAGHEGLDFSPYYIKLLPGERLVLLCWGKDTVNKERVKGHVHFAVYCWWLYGKHD